MSRFESAQPFFAAVLLLAACGPGQDEIGSSAPDMTFEEFAGQAYREPFADGVYIVDGDTAVINEKFLREFYDALYDEDTLIVNRTGNGDDRWNDTAKLSITYCVSDNFLANKSAVVAALEAATLNWQSAGNVHFNHLFQFDGACTGSQAGVVFDVRPISAQPYLARSFFPSSPRPQRNLLIDGTAFNSDWPLANILTHELGHVLGFRHEHTRPEAGTCFEDSNWRTLTPYDSASTMHYPQCNGTSHDLSMTQRDRDGMAALYGPPSGGEPQPPPPPPACTPQSSRSSGSLFEGQFTHYDPLSVAGGSNLRVAMTGSGDPDLYVRFGARPTVIAFHCRPYLAGPNENCDLTVPNGQSLAYISVRGFRTATYTINATWCQP